MQRVVRRNKLLKQRPVLWFSTVHAVEVQACDMISDPTKKQQHCQETNFLFPHTQPLLLRGDVEQDSHLKKKEKALRVKEVVH